MNPGLLDLPAPLLTAIDGLLSGFIPAALRVIVYGLLVSYFGMRIYARLSNQRRLRAVQRRTRQVRRQLHDPNIEFDQLLRVSRLSIQHSLRHLLLVLAPSLAAMLPFLLVFPWASNEFGAPPPAAGTQLNWCVDPPADAQRVRIGSAIPGADGCTEAPWPQAAIEIRIDDQPVASAPWSGSSEILHARRWWNLLLANPAGELPAMVGPLTISVQFPPRSLLPFGPDWLGSWLTLILVPGFVAGLYWRWRWKLV